ncbi:MAG: PD-(D/E)XK nuclease family protein, partial [Candidatus Hydrogenedentes bacterium]|nr:PD-(D/E)XK nuclease family protein [Candidatus Hydrogenedentota bacterium]
MGQITLIGGSAYSSRVKHIDALWKQHRNTALFLTPTVRLARARQSAFIREQKLPGLFGKCAGELRDFARTILEESGRSVRMVSMLERRLMVRQALENLPEDDSVAQLPITPGLVRHLLRVITELKQAAIEPDRFRQALMRNKSQGPFDGLVALVYEQYQEGLLRSDCYDIPGLYWEATRCCSEKMPPLPNNASIILLDGFDDFTLSQQRFLAVLAENVEHLVIGLHYDADPDRSDLFQLQQQWIENFAPEKPLKKQVFSTDSPQDYIQHIAHHIFWRNPPPSPAGLVANAFLLPCADAQHEIESLGRQVKKLLVQEKVRPQEIAVCLTDMEQNAGSLRTIFEGFGIPVSMQVAPRLLSTATGTFVMRIFETLNSWERNTVTSLLTSPLFKTSAEEIPYVMTFPMLSRELGITAITNPSKSTAFRKLSLKYEKEIAFFQERFRKLDILANDMPEPGSLREFAVLLDKQIDAFGMESAVADMIDPNMLQRETAAVHALRSLLEKLAGTTPQDILLTRNEFARFLEEAMGETRIAVRYEQRPGVYCCSLDGLRHERFSYVFLGGMNEGMLPQASPINAVYSESDLHRLRRLGLELPGGYEHTYRQRLRFYHGITAAQQQLVLSYRKQNASGRESLPSPFIVDIADMFEDHKINITHPDPGPDSFLPEPLLAASPRDLANIAYYRKYKQLRKPISEITDSIDRAAAIETQRNSTAPFGIYDGCIRASDLLEVLDLAYGETTQFSVNQLESYIQFPFRFFMERVLKVRETRLPESEMDPLTRGSLVHETLYRFHKHFAGLSVLELFEEDEAETRATMVDCVHAVFSNSEKSLVSVPEVVRKVERQRLEQVLQRYLTRSLKDFKSGLSPKYFEATFGRALQDAEEDLYKEEPFLLTINNETIRLTGKIDRIDCDGNTIQIIDYKSSGTPGRKNILAGSSLQLSVYAWAAEQHLLPGTQCVDAWYYSVYKNKKQDALFRKKNEEFAQREENAKTHIAAAVFGIRSGKFPPVPDKSLDTNRIPVHTAARHEKWRIE